MNKNQFIHIVIIFVITSCTIRGSFQGLYGYQNREVKKNKFLFINTDNCDSINGNKGKLSNLGLITKGETIRKCLALNTKNIIYIWGSKCKSKVCFPLTNIQKYCDEKGIDLFVLAEYYDAADMGINYQLAKNIIAVDTKFYNSNLTNNYLASFFNEIDDKIDFSKNNNNRYLYFENDKFLKSFNSVYEIK